MRKTTSRVLWILVGVLLVITGIACFAHPAATLGSLAILLGIAMLFSGVVDLVIFATARDAMYGSGWFLLDGVLTILLSIFILGSVYHGIPPFHRGDVAGVFRHQPDGQLI